MVNNSLNNNRKGGKKKMEVRTITLKQYFEVCSLCKKEIRGSSPNSAKSNLNIHTMSKHPLKNENGKA